MWTYPRVRFPFRIGCHWTHRIARICERHTEWAETFVQRPNNTWCCQWVRQVVCIRRAISHTLATLNCDCDVWDSSVQKIFWLDKNEWLFVRLKQIIKKSNWTRFRSRPSFCMIQYLKHYLQLVASADRYLRPILIEVRGWEVSFYTQAAYELEFHFSVGFISSYRAIFSIQFINYEKAQQSVAANIYTNN